MNISKALGILAAVVAISVPTITGILWVGALSNRVTNLETADDAALVVSLENMGDQVDELSRSTEYLKLHAHQQDIRWAQWDARWGHLIKETAPVNPTIPGIPTAIMPAHSLAPILGPSPPSP